MNNNTIVTKNNIKILSASQKSQHGLLRFITAGSVDDGKSTLIGRLLFDSKGIFMDQLDAISRAKYKHTKENIIDLSLLTDGLEAEREQGITIDVAYRYFATPKRKFIIADTPGHEQYTRNMITGASTADAQIILIDASKIKLEGNNHAKLLTQTKRHSAIAHLLQVQHIIIAVNKMDLVHYSQMIYDQIINSYLQFSTKIGIKNIYSIPLSALIGDNVVNVSNNLFWYKGPTLIELLESLPLYNDNYHKPFRFPIQLVTRHHEHKTNHFRGYMGRIESGQVTQGEKLLVLPSTKSATVKNILTLDGSLKSATTGKSITILLEEYLDVSRGDMLTSITNVPTLLKTIHANLCWLSENKFDSRCKYWLKHSTKQTIARITKIHKLFDINTQEYYSANTLQLNDIAQVSITAQQVIAVDAYNVIRATGAFILIDQITHQTVAAGIISTQISD